MSNGSSFTGSTSPDGSFLMAGAGGNLVTSDGTWTFNTSSTPGNYLILLNGQQVGSTPTLELAVANQGHLYAWNGGAGWYDWLNGSWSPTSAPTLAVTPGPTITTDLPNTQSASFQLQNAQSAALGPHEVSFEEVFSSGQVAAGSQLVATINGVNYAVQLDAKTSYADGSVATGILTLNAPAIAANSTLNAVLSAVAAPAAPAVDISKLPGNGYNLVVNLTLQNGNGTQTSYQLNAGSLLSQALASGTATYWLQGAQATEAQFDVPVAGSLHVTFDVTSFADGSTETDVQFNNDAAMQATGGTATYSETITQNGAVVSQQSNIIQYQYQDWDQQIWSNGAPQVNIQHDILGLEKTGAIPAYDLSWSLSNIDPNVGLTLSSEAAAMAVSGWNTITNGMLPVNGIVQYMPMTGGRPDIGPATDATALWLITQNQTATLYALGQADAAGSVPWNFFDPTTGNQLSVAQYPQLWTDGRGGSPNSNTTGLTQQVSSSTGWTPDTAHQPDLSYEAYLLTGNVVFLDHLNAQANFSVADDWPGWRDQSGFTDIVANGQDQVRAQAWSLRNIDEAAYANPDGSAEKAYFTQIMNDNWAWLVSQLPTWTTEQGQAYGWIPTQIAPNLQMSPWCEDFFATTAVEAAAQGNMNAVTVLDWMSNYLVGRFLPHAGWDMNDGAAYRNIVTDASSNYYQTWAQIETATQAAGISNGTGWANADYAELALESLAGIITVDSMYPSQATLTASAAAMQAYGWLLASGAPTLRGDAQFQIAPRLPDGNYLNQSNAQIDTTSNNLTLTTTPSADSLIHAGGGNDVLVGGTGTTDLLYGGTGNDTFRAGSGNEYMFGGSATNTFIDGTGNNYMQGAGAANIYVFDEAHSGHDTIANFNLATDTLQIGPNLNGNGLTTAAQLVATATVNNGNIVFHLSPNDDITLLGISTPENILIDVDGNAAPTSGLGSATAGTLTEEMSANVQISSYLMVRDTTNADLEVYDIRNNAVTDTAALSNVGMEWQVSGFGNFSDTTGQSDMIMRSTLTGDLEYYDIRANAVSAAGALGNVGLEWQVLGFGQFAGHANESEMVMRDTTNGDLEFYNISGDQVVAAGALGNIGLEWQVLGFGQFAGHANESDMVMRNTTNGNLAFYNIGGDQVIAAGAMGNIGSEWQIEGTGDFSTTPHESDLLMRNGGGDFAIFDVSQDRVTNSFAIGNVGNDWQVVGFGSFTGNANETDMLMRQSTSGALVYYDIRNNGVASAGTLTSLDPTTQLMGIGAVNPMPS